MHVVAHHELKSLQQMAARQTHARKHTRLRAVILAQEGWMASQIAEALGVSVRTIQQWVGDYNRQGLDGLKDRRGGNHRYLTPTQEQQLREHLTATAADPEGGVRHAAELLPHIEKHFGVRYSLSGLYTLLDRLGYEWLMPRPRHPGADPEAQAAFKKKRRRLSKPWPQNIRTNASKSGSRTKPASDNKAR
jgi:transposase